MALAIAIAQAIAMAMAVVKAMALAMAMAMPHAPTVNICLENCGLSQASIRAAAQNLAPINA